MNTIQHPSAWINPAAVDTIRNKAKEAEALQQLHPDQLALIYANKWFKLFVPKAYNGLELSLTEALQVEEALAWADGSLGWTVTLCSGANWFIGFLQPGEAAIFQEDTVCLAGSGKATGTATVVNDGYLINGEWNYATGAPHATHFTVNCIIEKEGIPQQNPDGSPLIRTFFFTKEEVTIHNNWRTTGMIATASHQFSVHDIWVPVNRCFRIDSDYIVLTDYAIYQYPFLQFAQATLAVNYSGMAQHFLDLCHAFFIKKDNAILLAQLQHAQTQLAQSRTSLYNAVEQFGQQHLTQAATETILRSISDTSYQLARVARLLVDEYYPLCGLQAADTRSELNLVWRDFHTATQHPLLNGVQKV